MNELITSIVTLRAALGLKELTNPKKLGKVKLEAMLEELQGKALGKAMVDQHEKSVVAPEVTAVVQPKAPETVASKAPVVDAPKVKKVTIKSIACEALQEVIGEKDGRTVGRSYQGILDQIKIDHPTVNTSLACLRWYAGKIRVLANGYDRYTLPQLRERHMAEPESTTPVADDSASQFE